MNAAAITTAATATRDTGERFMVVFLFFGVRQFMAAFCARFIVSGRCGNSPESDRANIPCC
jgi:hypothetical protein